VRALVFCWITTARVTGMPRSSLLVAALSFLAACTPTPAPNVLLIVIDTLRADHVGWSGERRQLTPFLDALAQSGHTFTNAYAQSSWTAPSMASLFTSRYPSQHGVRTGRSVLVDAEVTLAEVLKHHGYTTGAFGANRVLRADLGWQQGFDAYQILGGTPPQKPEGAGATVTLYKERGERLNAESLAWLDALRANGQPASPVLLYLQYMEPHIPYTAPADIVDRLMHQHENPERERQTYADMLFGHPGLWNKPTTEALQVINDLYAAEVISVDARLRELFAALEQRGFLSNAIVIITADHGDEHMEHGRIGHGTTLYNEVLKVPLLVRFPLQRGGSTVPDVVSLIDVAPTVLDAAGIPPPPSFEGQSLRRYADDGILARLRRLVGGDRTSPRVYSQLLEPPIGWHWPKRHDEAIVVGMHKLLLGDAGTESYDLSTDPTEQHPNGLAQSDQQALRHALEDLRGRAQRARSERIDRLDENVQHDMRALGYGD